MNSGGLEVKRLNLINIRSKIWQQLLNPLNANFTKWSNTLKQIADDCLSVFDHLVGLALKGLMNVIMNE